MIKEPSYMQQLENLIQDELLPVYYKYFKLLKEPAPELDPLILSLVKKRTPALFKQK